MSRYIAPRPIVMVTNHTAWIVACISVIANVNTTAVLMDGRLSGGGDKNENNKKAR